MIVHNRYNEKTFCNKNGSSVIDLIISSLNLYSKIDELKLKVNTQTPHLSVEFKVKTEVNIRNEIITKLDLDEFSKNINKEDLSPFITELTTCENSEQLNMVTIKLENYIKNVMAFTARNIQTVDKEKTFPWWSQKLELIRKILRNINKKIYKTKSKIKKLYLGDLRDRIKKFYRKEIQRAKSESWNQLLNSTEVFGKPYKILLRKKKRLEIPPIMHNDCVYVDKLLKIEIIMNTIFPVTNESINLSSHQETGKTDNIEYDYTETKTVTNSAIRSLKTRKASGLDGISNAVIKIIHSKCRDLLPTLYYCSLKINVFPNTWKAGKLVLINKPGKDPTSPSSYRPITLLSNMGKLYEKNINHHLNEFMRKHNVLNHNQFGFRRKLSTENAVRKAFEIINRYRNSHRHVLLVSFDVSGAFDKIKHPELINILTQHSFPSNLISLTADYLTNRTIGWYHESSSDHVTRNLTTGVPQGSVLGPVLFNIAMTNIHKINMEGNIEIISYADDILLIAGIDTKKEKGADDLKINSSIGKMSQELSKLGLKFNPNKTNSILISRRHDKEQVKTRIENHVKIDNTALKISNKMKYLGIIIDEKLNFSCHLDYTINKIVNYYKLFLALYGNTFGYCYKNRVILYKAIFVPLISYCSRVYYNKLTKYQNFRLRKTQRSIIKGIISGYKTISYQSVYAISGLMPIDNKIKLVNKIKEARETVRGPELKKTIRDLNESAIQEWQLSYDAATTGRVTYAFLPSIKDRINLRHLTPNFFMTQIMSGHGNFSLYLNKFKIKESATCEECQSEIDDVWHTLFHCEKHAVLRNKYQNLINKIENSGNSLLGLNKKELTDLNTLMVGIMKNKTSFEGRT